MPDPEAVREALAGAKLHGAVTIRAAAAIAMDEAATDLMVTAAELAETDDYIARALGLKVIAWERAISAYRNAGGLRNDNGGLRADNPRLAALTLDGSDQP